MIEAADLELLASGFDAEARRRPGAAEADQPFHELGWADALAVAPRQVAGAAFRVLGTSGAATCLLDDVVAAALGMEFDASFTVVLPRPHAHHAAGQLTNDGVIVDGVVSARLDRATTVVVPLASGRGYVTVDAESLRSGAAPAALDPDGPYRRVRAELTAADVVASEHPGAPWESGVRAARLALAHQLLGGASEMLEMARQHALDRTQFGRPIGSFQAVRHRLADTLVAIEGAVSVAGAATSDTEPDALAIALAKSLAGKAAKLAASNAQQVLGGIGFTTDHPFHRWFKRTLVLDSLFGSARTLPAEIGRELLTRGSAPRLFEL